MSLGRPFVLIFIILASAPRVHAGMTSYDLNDVVRLRLEDLSFFIVLLLVCGGLTKLLWNFIVRDFPKIPRLTYLRALALTGILSLMMLLVLSMISGARELLTPGAWRKQGSGYRLNDAANQPNRERQLEFLRAALREYAQTHGGKFPPHDWVPEIPEKIWQAEPQGIHFIYVTGLQTNSGTTLLACEPLNFGENRYVLLANGEIKMLATSEIQRLLGIKGP